MSFAENWILWLFAIAFGIHLLRKASLLAVVPQFEIHGQA